MHLKFRNVNDAFRGLVSGIHFGDIPTEVEASRYGEVIRVQEPMIVTYERPCERILFNAARDAPCFFSLYESLYFLAGRNDVAPLAYYNSRMVEFSDGGKTLNDSYGYRWRYAVSGMDSHDGTIDREDQLDTIVDHLRRKPESRRAVLQMWNMDDDLLKIDNSKAVCCNLSAVFRVEVGKCPKCDGVGWIPNKSAGVIDTTGVLKSSSRLCDACGGTSNDAPEFLNMTVFNRSNDLCWGMLGTNAVHFSFLLEYMAARLGLKVGKYHQVTADLHAYTKTWEPEKWLADDTPDYYRPAVDKPIPLVKDSDDFERECRRLVQFHSNGESFGTYAEGDRWEEPFLQTVAEPMFRAYHAYKFKSYDSALRWANLVAAPDWRVAARGWIQRRLERKGVHV